MLTVSLNFSLILKEEEEESHKGKPSRVIPSDWPKKKTKLLPLPAATRLVIKGLKCLHCSEKLNCNLLLYLNNDPTAKKKFQHIHGEGCLLFLASGRTGPASEGNGPNGNWIL